MGTGGGVPQYAKFGNWHPYPLNPYPCHSLLLVALRAVMALHKDPLQEAEEPPDHIHKARGMYDALHSPSPEGCFSLDNRRSGRRIQENPSVYHAINVRYKHCASIFDRFNCWIPTQP